MTLPSVPRRSLLGCAAALCAPLATWAQHPSAWPIKPVRLVVGYAAGGATDVIARLVGVKLGEVLGQPVVVENRAGANSNLGAEVVAKSSADGYIAVCVHHCQHHQCLAVHPPGL